jgi:hypothetical protein
VIVDEEVGGQAMAARLSDVAGIARMASSTEIASQNGKD